MPKITIAEFRATARIVLAGEGPHIGYLNGQCQIDLVVPGGPGYPEEGIFCLTIANYSAQGFDLAKFEAELFEWATDEGFCDKPEPEGSE